MTIEENIEAALLARVRTLDIDGDPPIAWPNMPFSPPAGPHIKALHFRNSNFRQFLGSTAPHLRQGILQLTVVTPLNGGEALGTKLAGQIAEHFPADLALYSEDVKVRIQRAPDVVTAEKTDVSWDARCDVFYEVWA